MAPKELVARQSGKCRLCGGKIIPGEKIKWGKDGGKGWSEHLVCPVGAQPDGQQQKITSVERTALRLSVWDEFFMNASHGFCTSTIPMTAEEHARRCASVADAMMTERAKRGIK